ncbi:MAG: alcohol dehydrogenase catalytic domain-containing protein [Acidimicrobiia bacterium]|nr:alcohol dehydrogenase catalytic domain-containing protein [Acidimicrobiia bacterium]MDH5504096.1 alcohol dehydrogenase catalytic domain-containing protein [Acidimicrobiia bacterium]
MKAVRVTAPSTLEIADVPMPEPGDQVLIKPITVGVCGTDVKVFTGAIAVDYPRILGHEVIGEVVAAPSESDFQAGDRVLIDPASSCGHCDLCTRGRPHLCRNAGLLGREIDGVFADYVLAPTSAVLAVPDTISVQASGLLQVLGTCVHALSAVTLVPGQVVAVIGLGVAGQLMVQLLQDQGVTVAGITRSEWKRDLAARNGAAMVTAPEDATSALADLTSGRGPDLVIEAVGYEKTLAQSIELVGIGGEVIVFGTLTGGTEGLPYYQLYYKELTLYNPRAALIGDYAAGIELAAAGRLALETVVTHELTLDEAARAFDLVHDPSSLKVLMHI